MLDLTVESLFEEDDNKSSEKEVVLDLTSDIDEDDEEDDDSDDDDCEDDDCDEEDGILDLEDDDLDDEFDPTVEGAGMKSVKKYKSSSPGVKARELYDTAKDYEKQGNKKKALENYKKSKEQYQIVLKEIAKIKESGLDKVKAALAWIIPGINYASVMSHGLYHERTRKLTNNDHEWSALKKFALGRTEVFINKCNRGIARCS